MIHQALSMRQPSRENGDEEGADVRKLVSSVCDDSQAVRNHVPVISATMKDRRKAGVSWASQ
jgi:hypothetical protein